MVVVANDVPSPRQGDKLDDLTLPPPPGQTEEKAKTKCFFRPAPPELKTDRPIRELLQTNAADEALTSAMMSHLDLVQKELQTASVQELCSLLDTMQKRGLYGSATVVLSNLKDLPEEKKNEVLPVLQEFVRGTIARASDKTLSSVLASVSEFYPQALARGDFRELALEVAGRLGKQAPEQRFAADNVGTYGFIHDSNANREELAEILQLSGTQRSIFAKHGVFVLNEPGCPFLPEELAKIETLFDTLPDQVQTKLPALSTLIGRRGFGANFGAAWGEASIYLSLPELREGKRDSIDNTVMRYADNFTLTLGHELGHIIQIGNLELARDYAALISQPDAGSQALLDYGKTVETVLKAEREREVRTKMSAETAPEPEKMFNALVRAGIIAEDGRVKTDDVSILLGLSEVGGCFSLLRGALDRCRASGEPLTVQALSSAVDQERQQRVQTLVSRVRFYPEIPRQYGARRQNHNHNPADNELLSTAVEAYLYDSREFKAEAERRASLGSGMLLERYNFVHRLFEGREYRTDEHGLTVLSGS